MYLLKVVWLFCILQDTSGQSQSVDCASEPCQNGALCTVTESGIQCFCVDGYAGELCGVNFDDCSSRPCQNNATCSDQVANYTCHCANGFTGKDCQSNTDECISNPCLRNGICVDFVNGYVCECVPPFRGDHCSLLPCDTVPCENEGVCRNDVGFNESLSGFVCDCITGFTGPRCEINIEDCDLENATSCSGNGLCVDGINDYSCLCEPGWVGEYCQSPVDDCIGNSCKNNATCTDLHLGYLCTCKAGYGGSLCERERDECSEWQPCKNGATCLDLFNTYRCECSEGWFGVNCTKEVNECDTNECQNGAQCLDVIGGFRCRCPPFYTGQFCETQYNPCAPGYNPCQNGANCIIPPDGVYRCFCHTGFTGVHCEVNVNECLSTPCENNSTCEDITAGYICHCTLGWEGQNCQDNIDDCASEPCLNGADCLDIHNGYECNCTREYQGQTCYEAVDFCLKNTCYHDSTCISFVGGYTCLCSTPYTGDQCLDLIDSCQDSPCKNNGTCMNTMSGFLCSCPLPFTGTTCNEQVDFCASEPCFIGTCVSLDDDFVCACPEFITGKQCTDLVDYCGESPCENEGNCINGEFDFRCVCAYGFTGRTCTDMVDFCVEDPCQNDANCTNIPGGFQCVCPYGFSGDLCQSVLPTVTVIPSTSVPELSTISSFISFEPTHSSLFYSTAFLLSSEASSLELLTSSLAGPSSLWIKPSTQESSVFSSVFSVLVTSATVHTDQSLFSESYSSDTAHSSVIHLVTITRTHSTYREAQTSYIINPSFSSTASSIFDIPSTVQITYTSESIYNSAIDKTDYVLSSTPSSISLSSYSTLASILSDTTVVKTYYSPLISSLISTSYNVSTTLNSEFSLEASNFSLSVSKVPDTSMNSKYLDDSSTRFVRSTELFITKTGVVSASSAFIESNSYVTSQTVSFSSVPSTVNSDNMFSPSSRSSKFDSVVSITVPSDSPVASSATKLTYSTSLSDVQISPTASSHFYSKVSPGTLTSITDMTATKFHSFAISDDLSQILTGSEVSKGTLTTSLTSYISTDLYTTRYTIITTLLTVLMSTFIETSHFNSFYSLGSSSRSLELSGFTSVYDYTTLSQDGSGSVLSTRVLFPSSELQTSSLIDNTRDSISHSFSMFTGFDSLSSVSSAQLGRSSLTSLEQTHLQSDSMRGTLLYSDITMATKYSSITPISPSSTYVFNSLFSGFMSSTHSFLSSSYSTYPNMSESFRTNIDVSSEPPSGVYTLVSTVTKASTFNSASEYNSPHTYLEKTSSLDMSITVGKSITSSVTEVDKSSINPTDISKVTFSSQSVYSSYLNTSSLMLTVSNVSGSIQHTTHSAPQSSTTGLDSSTKISGTVLSSSVSLVETSLLYTSFETDVMSTPIYSTSPITSYQMPSTESSHHAPTVIHSTNLQQTSPLSVRTSLVTSALFSKEILQSTTIVKPTSTDKSSTAQTPSESLPLSYSRTSSEVKTSTEADDSSKPFQSESIRTTTKTIISSSLLTPTATIVSADNVMSVSTTSTVPLSSTQNSAITTSVSTKATVPLSSSPFLQITSSVSSTTQNPSISTSVSTTTQNPPITTSVSPTTQNPPITTSASTATQNPPITTPVSTTTQNPPITTSVSTTTQNPPITTSASTATQNPPITTPVSTTTQNPPVTTPVSTTTQNPPITTSVSTTTQNPPITTSVSTTTQNSTITSSVSTTYQNSPITTSMSTSTMVPATTCDSLDCYNEGVCREDVSGTFCECGENYIGDQCENESTACEGYVCENGGVCVVTLTIYGVQVPKCNCPLPFVGSRCENEKLIYYPTFGGSSYLEFRSPEITSDQSNEIYISVKTTQRVATILYSTNQDLAYNEAAFISLHLINGKLQYSFSCDGVINGNIQSDMIVNKGDVYEIIIRQVWSAGPGDWCSAAMIINSQAFVSGPLLALRRSQTLGNLYIGGIPRFMHSETSPDIYIMDGFIGCVHNLQINQEEIDLVTMATKGSNIDNCNVPVCQHDPCKNGAICHSSGEEWYCSCLPGYGGALCERKLCGVNPCQHGGTCIVLEEQQDQICLCPYGRAGAFCEQSFSTTLHHFMGNQYGYTSYVAYDHPHYLEHAFEMEFSLILGNGSSDTSMLIFMGNSGSYDGRTDFMVVGLDKGHVVFRFNLGSGYSQIYSADELDISLSQHKVRLGRERIAGWIQVDNQRNVTGRSPGILTALNTNSKLYVGNLELSEVSNLPRAAEFEDGFKGCLFNLKVKSHITDFISPGSPPGHIVTGRNVGHCLSMSCDQNPCQNGAECRDLGASIYCICEEGWKGTFCTDKLTICDLVHACTSGSTCVPVIGLPSGYKCWCPLGKKGPYCEEDFNISDPLFLGEGSFMAVDPVYVKKKVDVKLQVKPNASDGLLFYVAQHLHSHSGDFLSITLHDDRVEMRINMGTDVNVIRHSKTLESDRWYTIEAGRNVTHGYIAVDGNFTFALLTGLMTFLDTTTDFYIGGLPSLEDAAPDAFENEPVAFQGCIRELVVNNRMFQLDINGAKDGRSIEDCDGTSCGFSVCKNGGTCSIQDADTFSCNCSQLFIGTTCDVPIACLDHQCRNGACRATSENNYLCDCFIGWTGDFCEEGTVLNTSMELTTESFVYIVDGNFKDSNKSNTYISFSFKTAVLYGLILWNGQTYSDDEDYFGVGIQDGRLKIVWNLGWYSKSDILTSTKVNDGNWHSITINREKQTLTINVDDTIYESRVSGDFYTLDTRGEYHIGSFKEGYVRDQTLGHYTTPFEGCLKDLQLYKDLYVDLSGAEDGRNIKPCTGD